MSVSVKYTMTPEERAAWERRMRFTPAYRGPAYGKPKADLWEQSYSELYRASEQMALVLEGLLAGRVSRAQISGALAEFRRCAK